MLRLDPFKLDRTLAALKQRGLDGALFTDYYNVSYLTGYTMFLENGPSPFTRGAAAALLLPGELYLLADAAAETSTVSGWNATVIPYPGYSAEGPINGAGEFARATLQLLRAHLPTTGSFGLELSYLPASIYSRILDWRASGWGDVPEQVMLMVRAVKSEDELRSLRAVARLAEVGQQAVYESVAKPGLSEIEVYNEAKRAMEVAAGGRIALQNALHGGVNSAYPSPGMPTNYLLQPGDLLISDMVPFYDGYWADSCSTFAVGRVVTDKARHIHSIARRAFERGFEAVRPGVTGEQLARTVLAEVERHGYGYSHHTGHGVGVSNHEEPRIVPGSSTVLEPGMVLLMEPAVYVEGFGGCRQERMVLVTADGAELLTTNSFELD